MTIRKTFGASTEALSDLRQVRVICSTPDADRVGDIVIQSGIDFKAYMASGAGPVLWNRDSNIVIAKCIDISVVNGCLSALVQFPDERAGRRIRPVLRQNQIRFGFWRIHRVQPD